jgi:hypothetical protein
MPLTSRNTAVFAIEEDDDELLESDPRLDVEIKDVSGYYNLDKNNVIGVDSDRIALLEAKRKKDLEFLDAIRNELDDIENIIEFNFESEDADSSIVDVFEEEDITEVALPPIEKSMSFHDKYVRPAINNVVANVAKTAKQSLSFSSYMNKYFDKHAGLLTGVIAGLFAGVTIAMIFPPALPLVAAIFIKGAMIGVATKLGALGILAAAFSAVSALAGLTADYFRNKITPQKEAAVKTEEKPVAKKTKKPLSTFAKISNDLTLATHYPVDENIHIDPGFKEEDRGLVFANNMFNQPLTSFDREPEKILVRNFKR